MNKWLAAAAMVLISMVAPAQAETPATKIRFTLDWKIQGLHAWFYWAKAKGYFKAENLDVSIDQGEGAAATVTRILSGNATGNNVALGAGIGQPAAGIGGTISSSVTGALAPLSSTLGGALGGLK